MRLVAEVRSRTRCARPRSRSRVALAKRRSHSAEALAQSARDADTERVAARILTDERLMASRPERSFDRAVEAVLAASEAVA